MTNAELMDRARLLLPYMEAARNGDRVLTELEFESFARLTQDLFDALAAQEWQPIETAPRDGADILGNYGPFFIAIMRRSDQDDSWTDGSFYYRPTHWRPLPAPPVSIDDTSPTQRRT
jgi:hypothetical protein